MMPKKAIVLLVMLLIFPGCAHNKAKNAPAEQNPPYTGTGFPVFINESPKPKADTGSKEPAAQQAPAPVEAPLAIKEAKTKTGLLTPAPTTTGAPAPSVQMPVANGKQRIVLNFDKADVAEVTNQIFGEYLQLNHALAPDVKGPISLYLEGEYNKAELFDMILKAYRANNYDIVSHDGLYIIKHAQRSTTNLPVADSFILRDDASGTRPVVVIYRLRYMNAAKAITTLKFFISPGRPITNEPMTNSIIFAEETANARNLIDLLRTLDMNLLEEVGVEIVPLKALSPEEAVKSMKSLMSSLDLFQQSAIQGKVALLPLERFGGVLILAQDQQVLETLKRWMQNLDVQGQESGEQVFVYHVENGLAKDIADILSQVYENKDSKSKTKLSQRIVEPEAKAPPAATPQAESSGGGISTALTGEVKIIADEVNNAVVVKANKADYEKIYKTLKALDILPRTVLIQVLIAEVRLTDGMQYGVEWYLKNMNLGWGGGSLNPIQYTNPLSLASGLSLTGGTASKDIEVTLEALAARTFVNILSAPTVMAQDNQEASITIGGREPIVTSETVPTSTTDEVTQTIQYEDTGIILKVTPHVNSSGLVRLEIDQTLRDVAEETTKGIDSPRFTERLVKTNLVVENGQTVIMGGIMEESLEETNNGVPVLEKVPLLKFLFSSTDNSIGRTELIIAITPYVIERGDNYELKELVTRLKGLRDRIDRAISQGVYRTRN